MTRKSAKGARPRTPSPARRRALAAALLTSTALIAAPAAAQEWSGGFNHNWGIGANWNGGVAPTSTTDPIIRNATGVRINNFSARGRDLDITNGGLLIETNGDLVLSSLYMARDVGSNASILVSGAGARLDSGIFAIVGELGSASLVVADGGRWDARNFIIGNASGSTGNVDIGAGGTFDGTTGILGAQGLGVLRVHSGGVLTLSQSLSLGFAAGGVGTLRVEGATAIIGDLSLGGTFNDGGQGLLMIGSGSNVTTGDIFAGGSIGSFGEIIVNSARLDLDFNSQLRLGQSGSALARVTNNGLLTAGGVRHVLGENASGLGRLMISDSGVVLLNGRLVVGGAGEGYLDLATDGYLMVGDLTVGEAPGGRGWVTLDDAAISVDNGDFYIGDFGAGDLMVRNGSLLSVGLNGSIGISEGSQGTATVTGAFSEIDLDGDIQIAAAGAGVLNILDGGLVESANGGVGVSVGGDGRVLIRNGSWNNAGHISIGEQGTGAVEVDGRNGASVIRSDMMTLGFLPSGAGRLELTGSGARLEMDTGTNGWLTVGREGRGEVFAEDGARIDTLLASIGERAGGEGLVSLAGGSQWWNGYNLIVGEEGQGELRILDGSLVVADYLGIGTGIGGQGNVIVADSDLSVTDLSIGVYGLGDLTATNSVIGVGINMILGGRPDAVGTALISGSTARLDVIDTIVVGDEGTASLRLENGAEGTAHAAYVAGSVGSTGELLVDGAGSSLILDAGLGVGEGGTGTFVVRNGAVAAADELIAGREITGDGTVRVAGSGSTLTIGAGGITAGERGDGRVIVEGGARLDVAAADNIFGDLAGSTGLLTVSGAGSEARFGQGALTFGRLGYGEFDVSDGGYLQSRLIIVGAETGGQWGAGTVDGAGSRLDVTDLLLGVGTNGSLSVFDGGEVSAAQIIMGEGVSALGSLNVSYGGSVDATSVEVAQNGRGELLVGVDGVMTASNVIAGVNFDSQGLIRVHQGGELTADHLTVGQGGIGRLIVSLGGNVTAPVVNVASSIASGGQIIIGGEDAAAEAGAVNAGEILFGSGYGEIIFNHTDADYAFAAELDSTGIVDGYSRLQQLSGVTRLTGAAGFNGIRQADIHGGTLLIDGGLNAWSVNVLSGGTLGGAGEIIGDTEVSGTLLGRQGQQLLFQGNLVLNNGSQTNVALGVAGSAGQLFTVAGDLQTGGTLNIEDMGGFGPGLYQLFVYGGVRTGADFVIGGLPGHVASGEVNVQYATGEINLVSTAQQALTFWDGGDASLWDNGAVNGGSGTWSVGVASFTDYAGASNGDFQPMPAFAVFQGPSGTVTVDDGAGALSVTGMQFASDGYVLTGGSIALADAGSIFRVGNGSQAGAAMTARIATVLTGSGGLVKSDLGTLELTGANTYAGDTVLRGGVLAINGDGALGAASGEVVAEGGDLRLLGDWETARGLTLTSQMELDTNGFEATLLSEISGVGALVKTGQGRLTLAHGNGSWTGGVDVEAGELDVTGQIGGDVMVRAGAGLFGTGTIGGDTTLLSGGSLNGVQGQTLTFGGNLNLNSGTQVNVNLSSPGSQALFDVGGGLMLDGILNVTSAGEFGAGVYRLFNYGGVLTNNGLEIGLTPLGIAPSDLAVQTSVAGQVNLLNSNDATLLFWDGDAAGNAGNGQIDGGAGVWSLSSANWTDADGLLNGAINPVPGFAVFMGQGGLVTVDGSAGAVSVDGMQFASDGYLLTGDAIGLANANTVIRVGDGTAAGASMTATLQSILSGSGRLVKSDLGTLILTGANTYTGGTYVQAGTLVGSSATIRGDIVNEGVVRLDQTMASSDLGGTTSGSGEFIKAGAGSLRLTGASSSDWMIEQGALTVMNGFTGDVAMTAGTVLTFDQSNGARVWGGVLSGSGALTIDGAGMATFTGQSQGFTGTTEVAGWLSIDGRLGGTVDVLTGGRLQGSGRVGDLNVAGTINPGNSIGTLQVDGDLTFLAGSVYEVEVNPQGQSDRINVLGMANLLGGSVLSLGSGGNYAPQTSYTILTAAGGVTGQFGSVASDLAFLDAALDYTASSVVLTLTRNDIDFAAVAWTPNQQAAAPAVEALGMGDDVWDAVVALSAEDARYAFDQLSGDAYGSLAAAQVEDGRMVRDAFIGRLREDTHRGPWMKAYGLTADHDTDLNAGRLERDLTGVVMGADMTLLNGWRVGVGGGYAVGDHAADTRGMAADSDTWSLGGYAGQTKGAVMLNVGAAYSWTATDAARAVIFPGFAEINRADIDGQLGQVFAEASWSLPYEDTVTVEPYVGAAFIHWRQDGFAETGGTSALSANAVNADLGLIRIGARAGGDYRLDGSTLRLNARAGLRQMVGDTDVTPVMAIGGQTMDGVRGLSVPGLAAEIELGAEIKLRENLFITLAAQALASANNTDAGATLNASWRF